jgi:hypothetical protein
MGKYISEFSGSNHSKCYTIYHKQRKFTKYVPYSYPIYRIYHYSYILAVARSEKSLCGKNAGARIVTNKETEDFHSELPSRIAVLLAN